MPLTHIAVTSGEPAGIGIDITLALAHIPFNAAITVLGDRAVLAERAAMLGVPVKFSEPDDNRAHVGDGQLSVLHLPTSVPVQASVAEHGNATYVLKQLELATEGCLNHQFGAMVTAPVNKAIINQAGYAFTGHTEYLGTLSHSEPVMMLASKQLRVALVTTHLPLHKVPAAITQERLTSTLSILNDGLKKYCKLTHPRIGVCGLNPHAGEQGYLGHEEQTVIIPVIEKLIKHGLSITGPFPADTVFIPHHLKELDVVVAMFHDQGLPVIKHSGFGSVVNVTLGLPFLRSSVDHGTALPLAGSGKASCASLKTAIEWVCSAITTNA